MLLEAPTDVVSAELLARSEAEVSRLREDRLLSGMVPRTPEVTSLLRVGQDQ